MKRASIFISLLLFSFLGKTQNQEINGTILAFNKYPLKNVIVNAKKNKTEAITDELGMFKIFVKKNDVLTIKAVDFEDYIYRVKARDNSLEVNLIYKVKKKYKKSPLVNAHIGEIELKYGLSHLADENNPYSHYTDIYTAINDAIPSAIVIIENGQRKFQLRGTKSLTRSNAALIVVNGVKTDDISYINTNQILSIKQLSLSSSAIYGTGSANGVISITTK